MGDLGDHRGRSASSAGRPTGADRLTTVRARLLRDLERTAVVAVDPTTVGLAASLAESTGVRSLDAVHLASMQRLASRAMRPVTFDARMAAAARDLGIGVVGA